MNVWINIAASNNPWSSGVTPEHLAAIARAAPVVPVFDVPKGAHIGTTTGHYQIRADGCELWALCELELEAEPPGSHAEAVLMQKPHGPVELGAVAVTALPRGGIRAWMERRYVGRVGSL